MYKIDFQKPIHIHFIGIGGISMSGLAEILLEEGFAISGSDMKESPLTKQLASERCPDFLRTDVQKIFPTILTLWFTPQPSIKTNPELMEAVSRKIPMLVKS